MSILGVDVGTTGAKAIAFNEEGRALGSSYADYNLIFPQPSWVEFEVKPMWDKVFNVIREVNASPEVKKDPVTALAVSTIGESFTPIDKDGNILYNTIYSTDSRSVDELEEILSIIPARELYNITGLPPQYVTALNKIYWVKKKMPEIYAKTKKFLFTEDLFHHLLGLEETRMNHPLCSTSLFFDIRKKEWSKYILDKCNIDMDLFSKPCPSGVEIGYVREDIAQDLGFRAKVSIVTGAHDQQSAALGVGAIKGGIAADGMGTVECVTPAMDELILKDELFENDYSTRAHAVDGKYVSFVYNFTSGSVLKWYRDVICNQEKEEAKAKGTSLFKEYFSQLDYNPSPMYTLPYFSGSGTPYHDPIPKGSIIGLNLATTKVDIFKALIEGLIFEIAFNIELAEKCGLKINELRAVGGGAKSDYELKLKAAVTGKPIKQMGISEAGCLATMMLAGKGTQKFTLEEAVPRFVKINQEFAPDPQLKEKYQDKFENYKKVYKLVSELYSDGK
ncbi:MAG: FGGY family carbohydrate kinase [Actinomycetota bacterium]|nr:FGGY family carbohydrate kinase [Actinomycetota bacterium]